MFFKNSRKHCKDFQSGPRAVSIMLRYIENEYEQQVVAIKTV